MPGAKRDEFLLLLIDVNPVARQNIDVVFRVHHEIFEGHRGAAPVPLKHDPGRVARSGDAARAGDGIENTVAGAGHLEPRMRSGVFTEPTTLISDVRCCDQGHDNLRLDRAILDLLDDIVLNLDVGRGRPP